MRPRAIAVITVWLLLISATAGYQLRAGILHLLRVKAGRGWIMRFPCAHPHQPRPSDRARPYRRFRHQGRSRGQHRTKAGRPLDARRPLASQLAPGGRFQPIDVETGAEAGGQTEIRKGLVAGQKVVLSGQFLIDSETNLKGAGSRMSDAPAIQAIPETKATSK